MVATDTVVGIVGAVLLVAVMAGVFAYEYNNPATTPAGAEGTPEHFMADYPSLGANDDIDGDGKANFNDTDIDGDGVANEMDSDVAVHKDVSGNIPMTASPTATSVGTVTLPVGTGAVHILGFVNYTAAAPAPLPTQPVLQVTLVDGSGQTVINGAATTSGSTVSVKIDTGGNDLPAGQYELRISMTGANPQARAYSGSIAVHYDAPAMGGHMHM